MWKKDLDLHTTVIYNGVEYYSVYAEWHQKSREYPTFRVTLSRKGKFVDLYWLIGTEKELILRKKRQTRMVKELTDLVIEAGLQHVKANLEHVDH